VYVIAVEEVHWRIHIGGWLPSWLHSGREHHLIHHDRPTGRYKRVSPAVRLASSHCQGLTDKHFSWQRKRRQG
jgi:hypothetical protein